MKEFHTEFKKVLERYQTTNKVSQRTIAQKAGVSDGWISQLATGRIKNPSSEHLHKLSAALGYDLNALAYECSTGKPLQQDASPLPDWLQAHAIKIDWTKMRKVPIFDVAAGGFLFEGQADSYPAGVSDEYQLIETTDPGAVFLRVHGESMIGAGIFDGDLLLIEPSREVKPGDIVICNKNGDGITVKKLTVSGNTVILQPMNPAYSPIALSKEEAAECRFFKVVIAVRNF